MLECLKEEIAYPQKGSKIKSIIKETESRHVALICVQRIYQKAFQLIVSIFSTLNYPKSVELPYIAYIVIH